MAGYIVSSLNGVTIPNAVGDPTFYPYNSVVPLAKLLPANYQWMVLSGILSETESGFSGGGGSVAWGAITGTLSAQTDLNTALNSKLNLAGGTLTGKLVTLASATGTAGIALPHGAAPTTPSDGDVWTTTAGMYVRINGTTIGPLASSAGGATWGTITGTLSSQTDLQSALDLKAALAGPTFTGAPAAPTAAVDTNTTQLATTAYVVGQGYLKSSTASSTYLPLTGGTLTGALTLSSSQHTIKNGTPTTLNFVKASMFGYSSGYRTIVFGDTGTSNATSLAFGVDVVDITSGAAWSGDGREVIFRNAQEFMTPNSGRTAFLKPMKWDSSGNTTLLGLTLTGDLNITKDAGMLTINGSSYANPVYFRAYRAAGQFGGMLLATGSTSRWLFGVNGTGEAGSDAGSDFVIRRYSDAGASLGDALTITRSSGAVALSGALTVSGTTSLPTATSIGSVTSTEIGYLSGVTSAIQTQLSGKAPLASPTFTGTPLSTTAAVDTNTTQIATTAYVVGQGYLKSATASSTYAPLSSPTFTGTVVLPSTTSIGTVSDTEIGYLDGVTSSIQTQLANKSDTSHTHLYAGSASAGGAANSVANSLAIKFDSGTTEGTDLYTFNGSAAKTLNIVAGSNITLTETSGQVSIASTGGTAAWGSVTGTLSSQTDLQTALNAKLSLTGGTLTGKLTTIASATGSAGLTLPHGAAPTTPVDGDIWTTTAGAYVRINGATVGPLASSAGAGVTWGAITGTLSSQTDLQSALDAKLNLSGGTLTGDLTISKATSSLSLTSSSGISSMSLGVVSGTAAQIKLLTGTSLRWTIQKTSNSESGSNAGSNFQLLSYADDGTTLLGTLVSIVRSTGVITLGGDTVVDKVGSSAYITVRSNTGSAYTYMDRPAGQYGLHFFRTAGSQRWYFGVDNVAEAGSNAGSNFSIYRYDDTATGLGTALNINRATGLTTLSSLTVSGALTTSASTTAAAGLNIPHGTAPTTGNNGDIWTTTSGIGARINGTNILVAITTLTTSMTQLQSLATTTGTLTMNIGHGATTSGTTKTVNLGTSGVSGSITNVNIGSAVAGATGTTTINSPTIVVPAGTGVTFGSGGARIMSGANTPESVVTAPVGSMFLRTNGGAGTTLYIKESGTGNTGWVAK